MRESIHRSWVDVSRPGKYLALDRHHAKKFGTQYGAFTVFHTARSIIIGGCLNTFSSGL